MRGTIRNKTIVLVATVAVAAAFAAQPAAAATQSSKQSSKQENIGLGAGALIGAAAAGPFGFVIGAAVGAKLGDSLHQRDEQIAHLEQSLDVAGHRATGLEDDVTRLNATIAELRNIARPELIDLMQAGIAMDLLFRTNEAVLADTTGERLAELGSMLAAMPDIQVRLDGFADERGDAAYNQVLSENRVSHIRDLLIASGIDAYRISTAAHGESPAIDQTADSYALERRVSVKLYLSDTPALAANPD